MERITSRTNPLCTHIRKLATQTAYRRKAGQFLCEGGKLLQEAVRWGAQIETLVVAEGVEVPVVPHARMVEVPADLLHYLADTETPQGVLFLCQLPQIELPDALEGGRYLILDGVQDPGNVGTIWRTADAFGADGLILVGACADPFAPKVVRATMGAAFRLPIWRTTWERLAPTLERANLPLYATALREDTLDLEAQNLHRCAVVIGSEGKGVSEETLGHCTCTLKIPMEPKCESLNAAVAATVVLWEMGRTHR